MSERINQILGGSPIGVAIRLILISILVGFILSWLNWNPHDIIDWVIRSVEWAWRSLFGSVERAVYYFLLGAAIVVPVFIISRLLKMGRR
ncbi:DUF6460 domain-containing protein [Aurantimonas sp. 22II-16-19i]|uniref:DUF6460 domain-containing protein n=1 Tax=Aurantimonas sp. 22II-16-19i TaxID=1317114 RepID=UPI0009F7BA25|nr:DUF6460 domain-containing protein [Aurantimonas sp. 22II-16-19i]ORE96911.1 hypothetical protein ATO4_11874 [Aurantimonas sp. 22II-16-19i]